MKNMKSDINSMTKSDILMRYAEAAGAIRINLRDGGIIWFFGSDKELVLLLSGSLSSYKQEEEEAALFIGAPTEPPRLSPEEEYEFPIGT